jgi:hypothetical protein
MFLIECLEMTAKKKGFFPVIQPDPISLYYVTILNYIILKYDFIINLMSKAVSQNITSCETFETIFALGLSSVVFPDACCFSHSFY